MRTHILLINDDPAKVVAVRRALINSTKGAFAVESTGSCSEALERITRNGAQYQQRTIAAVVVDLSLPDSRGLDTIDRLLRAAPQIPILVLSAPQDQAAEGPAGHRRTSRERRGAVRSRACPAYTQLHRRRGHEPARRGILPVARVPRATTP